MERLNAANLKNINRSVQVPQYERNQYRSGIVHIGIGAFHRAHQALFTDDALNKYGGNWRIIGVSLRHADTQEKLAPQDYLYTVTEKSDSSSSTRVVGSIEKVIVAPQNPQLAIDTLTDPNIKIVTVTVTEKGYYFLKSGLDFDAFDIQFDLTNLQAPTTFPGLLTAACAQRKKNGIEGFTVISCDNLQNNGGIARCIVNAFAQKVSHELADWIERNIYFCSSMVDRIVPAITEKEVDEASDKIMLEDRAALICEPFKQWVIENNFHSDRPQWDGVGATITNNVPQYEKMKLRLLNGSHSALAYLGLIAGLTYVHKAMATDYLAQFVDHLMKRELALSLKIPEDFDLENYIETIQRRFLNTQVPYRNLQVASDGSKKLLQRLLDPAVELSNMNKPTNAIALVIAAWFRFLEGKDEHKREIVIVDPISEKLMAAARTGDKTEATQVDALINACNMFPDQTRQNAGFKADITKYLTMMHQQGVKATLEQFNLEPANTH